MIRGAVGRGESAQAGFTIIEVLFFLAISGGLVVALLIGVGSTISRQRFTDSMISTQAFVQSQYSETLNVINDRTGGGCAAVSGSTVLGGASAARGASGCVVLGKSLEFSPNSATITTHSVIGREPANLATSTASGKDLLAAYNPGIDTDSASSYDAPWDAHITAVRRLGSSDRVSRLLLLRSPDSGLVLTFGDNGGASLQGALGANTASFSICLQSADLISAFDSVMLSPASGEQGVTTKADLTTGDRSAQC